MSTGGVLEVHDDVVFEANTAGDDGGAVSPPFKRGSHTSVVVVCDTFCKSWFYQLREST